MRTIKTILAVTLILFSACQKDYYLEDLEAAQSEINALQNQLAQANKENQERVNTLNTEVSHLETLIVSLEDALSTSEAELATSQEEIALHLETIALLTEEIIVLEETVLDLMAQLEAKQNSINSLEAELVSESISNDSYTSQVASLKQEIAALTIALNEAQAQVLALLNEASEVVVITPAVVEAADVVEADAPADIEIMPTPPSDVVSDTDVVETPMDSDVVTPVAVVDADALTEDVYTSSDNLIFASSQITDDSDLDEDAYYLTQVFFTMTKTDGETWKDFDDIKASASMSPAVADYKIKSVGSLNDDVNIATLAFSWYTVEDFNTYHFTVGDYTNDAPAVIVEEVEEVDEVVVMVESENEDLIVEIPSLLGDFAKEGYTYVWIKLTKTDDQEFASQNAILNALNISPAPHIDIAVDGVAEGNIYLFMVSLQDPADDTTYVFDITNDYYTEVVLVVDCDTTESDVTFNWNGSIDLDTVGDQIQTGIKTTVTRYIGENCTNADVVTTEEVTRTIQVDHTPEFGIDDETDGALNDDGDLDDYRTTSYTNKKASFNGVTITQMNSQVVYGDLVNRVKSSLIASVFSSGLTYLHSSDIDEAALVGRSMEVVYNGVHSNVSFSEADWNGFVWVMTPSNANWFGGNELGDNSSAVLYLFQ